MASSTTTHRRPAQQGRPLRASERRPGPSRPLSSGDSAPWSDEERTAAGLKPIGTGPGTPRQTSERSRRNVERRAAFEHQEAEDKAKAEAKAKADKEKADAKAEADRQAAHAAQRHQEASSLSSGVSEAASGLKGLMTGKGAGTIAGTVFGLILFAMGEALLNGGPREVAGWLGAKFINKPYKAPKAKTTAKTGPVAVLTSYSVPASSGSPASMVA